MNRQEVDYFLSLPLVELVFQANKIRQAHAGRGIDLCNILNAKSGACAQDCKFCAQSAKHNTAVNIYPLKEKKEIFAAAKRAQEIGAHRFDIVTSGNNLSEKEFRIICAAISEIRDRIGIKICASLGKLVQEQFFLLKQAGLTRYHHNIETSPRYFPKIVTKHTFEERIETLKFAKKAGLEVCSGGIIGLGETEEDRIDMACILRELDVDSVPLNILVPIKGTPLEKQKPISGLEAVRTIAIFRIILKDKTIKIAAGRESVLKDFQSLAFMSGANGMLIGGYLTIKGRGVEEDWGLIREVKRLWK